jgi:hypothetical protein
LAWFLFLLAVAGGVGFSVWNYRRKAAASKAARDARFEQIFKAKAAAGAASNLPVVSPPESAIRAMPVAQAAASISPPRDRFLGQSETLIYYLLKTGVPDHEVFANATLASVVGAPGNGRDREQVRRLSQYQLDFVVCDKSMRVVAVVDVESAAGAATAGDQSFKTDILRQAGIRVVRVNPAAPPRRERIRALISGEPPQRMDDAT